MGTWLPPGSCDAELKALKDAKDAMDKAALNYQSAKHNMQAGAITTGAAGVGAIGCLFAATGIGAIICVAAAGGTMVSGVLWTESAGESLINATSDLEDAIKNTEDALKAACKCYDSHAVSVPD